ncbi:hypothetical protein V5799_012533 [Amblyomma americanum]|uniref:TIL domain-containing protein n=1 Tax=Amblyomma americanum TaxID=6943 RepID=A0AAQ4EDY9_AMBAM
MLTAALLYIVIAYAWRTASSSANTKCGFNEEPGDPCARPDSPCFCNVDRKDKGSRDSCPGCVCKEGFRRTLFGECVNQTMCELCDEEPFSGYKTCGTACPLVCNETVARMCARICVQGCFCYDGYIRSSTTNGTCVLIKDCPPLCPDPSMVFSQTTSCNPPSCDQVCPSVCGGPGCQCPPDMFLQNGTCVQQCAQD